MFLRDSSGVKVNQDIVLLFLKHYSMDIYEITLRMNVFRKNLSQIFALKIESSSLQIA